MPFGQWMSLCTSLRDTRSLTEVMRSIPGIPPSGLEKAPQYCLVIPVKGYCKNPRRGAET